MVEEGVEQDMEEHEEKRGPGSVGGRGGAGLGKANFNRYARAC